MIYRRGSIFYLEFKWRNYLPRLRMSTGTTLKARAKDMERTIYALKNQGRKDLLTLLLEHRVTLTQVHDEFVRGGIPALEMLNKEAESPELRGLVAEWFKWLESPNGVSPRTRRRYAPNTIYRYGESWANLFSVLPKSARLSDLTKSFMADYRKGRNDLGKKPATVNRDLTALQAFMTWCAEEQGLVFARPQIRRDREPTGRERWLSSEEISNLQRALPEEWWPLVAVLLYTGLRIGEAQGLLGADVRLRDRRISIQAGHRSVKTPSSIRDVPIPAPLAEVLAEHFVRFPGGPSDPVFPGLLGDYRSFRRVWKRACRDARIRGATPHDCRHTFSVHCAQAGVPIVRLQKLLGHSTPTMSMRYMKHAPEAYFDEDAAKVAASLSGELDREKDARVAVARGGLRKL